jgi:hypothetical protein
MLAAEDAPFQEKCPGRMGNVTQEKVGACLGVKTKVAYNHGKRNST